MNIKFDLTSAFDKAHQFKFYSSKVRSELLNSYIIIAAGN